MLRKFRRAVIAAASALTFGIGGAVWATSSASAAPASVPPVCTTGNLAVWVNADQSSGAAGTFAYPLEFTNLTGHTCRMWGFPGVSLTTMSGKQLGYAAGRSHLFKAHWVKIPAHRTAHADLFWTNVGYFTSGCKPTKAALIKVYPPNRTRARTGFFDLRACRLKVHRYLHVTVVRPGPKLDV